MRKIDKEKKAMEEQKLDLFEVLENHPNLIGSQEREIKELLEGKCGFYQMARQDNWENLDRATTLQRKCLYDCDGEPDKGDETSKDYCRFHIEPKYKSKQSIRETHLK